TLQPESRNYHTQDMTVAAPDIDSSWWRDIYVAMGQATGPTTWAMRLQLKPMLAWVWLGFLMMSARGVLAAWRSALPPVPRSDRAPARRASSHASAWRESPR